MSEKKSEEKPEFDPFAPWRSFRDSSLESWSKVMAEAVGTEAFAESLGKMLNSYLETSAPMQKIVEQYMEAYLKQMNMPSRSEVISIAERLTHLELRLDDLDAKVDQILELMVTLQKLTGPGSKS
ncbi:MAG: hypothetical protein A2Z04_02540 [Chloroflexi bacterium RBG_16_57_9]|nr:MAG: hypothetical protein A2Z04_02540 [Chloroflexi bacterium RBG_16_57_9]